MGKIKATARSQRSKNPGKEYKHADRQFDISKADHIDGNRVNENIYWNCYDGLYSESNKTGKMDFAEAERKFYIERYSEALDIQNQKHIAAGNKKRCKTMEDWISNKQKQPDGMLFQIGNQKDGIDKDVLLECFKEFLDKLEKYKSNFHIIDWALHADEATPHIELRAVFDYDDNGVTKIGQDKALEMLGFDLCDPTKKKGQYNNRKQTFSSEIREQWYEILEEHGFEIDREVRCPSQKHLDDLEYKTQQEKKKMEELEQDIFEKSERIKSNTKKGFANRIVLNKDEVDCLVERNMELENRIRQLQSDLDVEKRKQIEYDKYTKGMQPLIATTREVTINGKSMEDMLLSLNAGRIQEWEREFWKDWMDQEAIRRYKCLAPVKAWEPKRVNYKPLEWQRDMER
jgi:hypothetical protein